MVQAAGASLVSYDHVDAVAVDLPPGTNAEGFTRLLLSSPPRWTGRLMAVRDRLVAPFGLRVRERTAAQDIRIEPGVRKGPFTVLEVREDEILCGDDDKHLSFRASFAVRPGPDGSGPEGVCTTGRPFQQAGRPPLLQAHRALPPPLIASLLARAAS